MSFWANLPEIFLEDFQITFGRYLVAVAVTVALVWVLKRTSWQSRQIQPRSARWSDIGRELRASLESNLVFLIVSLIMVWGVEVGIFQRIRHSLGVGTDLLLLAAVLVAHDTYFYWTHRMMHHPKLYKAFHYRHHRSTTPTPFAAYAFAAPEALLNALFIPLWQLFVATPGTVMVTFLVIQIIRNTTQHAGLELHPRWWLRNPLTRWISTTTHHDMHHSGGFATNYGFYFSWWDKMMGTEHPDYQATFARVVGREAAAAPAGLGPSPTL
jgi:Delta7-sterol 5-desaturase